METAFPPNTNFEISTHINLHTSTTQPVTIPSVDWQTLGYNSPVVSSLLFSLLGLRVSDKSDSFALAWFSTKKKMKVKSHYNLSNKTSSGFECSNLLICKILLKLTEVTESLTSSPLWSKMECWLLHVAHIKL